MTRAEAARGRLVSRSCSLFIVVIVIPEASSLLDLQNPADADSDAASRLSWRRLDPPRPLSGHYVAESAMRFEEQYAFPRLDLSSERTWCAHSSASASA